MNQTTIYQISGLTCNNCANKVRIALAPYTQSVQVSLNPPQISITAALADIATLNNVLKNVGHYAIGQPINSQTFENNVINTHENRQLETKIVTQTFFNDGVINDGFINDDVINHDVINDDVINDGVIDNDIAERQTQPNEQTNLLLASLIIYKPLILVFSYILLVCLCIEIADGEFILHRLMPNFMAGFFLVFSFFKMLDLAGFASSYAMYDVIAKRFPVYGFVYPAIELALGLAYIVAPNHAVTNIITLAVMVVSLIGVVQAVLSKQKIKCACLGAGFNLPMTSVTIIEDSLMAVMAALMLM